MISCYTDADINFEWSGSVVNIECKRPQTQKALKERVKELTGGRQHPTTQRPTSIRSTLPLAILK